MVGEPPNWWYKTVVPANSIYQINFTNNTTSLPINTAASGNSTNIYPSVWVTNPYPYQTIWTFGIDGTGKPSHITIPNPDCGKMFKRQDSGELLCYSCLHEAKRHIINHQMEEDHCMDCQKEKEKYAELDSQPSQEMLASP